MNFEPDEIWRSYSAEELDRQYDARASVPSFDAEYARYVMVSARGRTDRRRIADLVYDPVSGEKLDLYLAGPNAPLFVWVHGGYWRALSKEDNGFAALGLLERGISVAVINYTLCPTVRLAEIVRQVRQSVVWLRANAAHYGVDARRIHAGGSSAGGHLVGMLMTGDWLAEAGLPTDAIGTVLALSGLFDIEPLLHTKVNSWLHSDVAEARRLSPIRHIPAQSPARLIASVGGLETDEFKRQTEDFAAAWQGAGHDGAVIEMNGYNHFNIALSLSEPDGVLCNAVRASIG